MVRGGREGKTQSNNPPVQSSSRSTPSTSRRGAHPAGGSETPATPGKRLRSARSREESPQPGPSSRPAQRSTQELRKKLRPTPGPASESQKKEQSADPSRAQSAVERRESREEKKKKKQEDTEARRRKRHEMFKNGVMYLTSTVGNKHPIRKFDFIKRVLNGDKRSSASLELMMKITKTMTDVYGLTVWGYNDVSGAEPTLDIMLKEGGYNFWLVVSDISGVERMITKTKIKARLAENNHDDDERSEHDEIADIKKALLVMFLTIIFMQNPEVGIDESQLWSTITAMDYQEKLNLVEKDFKKWLKAEFLVPMYLRTQEQRIDQQGITVTRYVWGVRSHLEFSQWTIFKHAIQQFPGSKPADFPAQLQIILNSIEKRAAVKELEKWELYAGEQLGGSDDESDDASVNDAGHEENEVKAEIDEDMADMVDEDMSGVETANEDEEAA